MTTAVPNEPPTKHGTLQLLFGRIQELRHGEIASWVGFPTADGDRHGNARGRRVVGQSAPGNDAADSISVVWRANLVRVCDELIPAVVGTRP